MALFESYERRIDKINGVLAQYGIESVEACREMCQAKGFDPYEITGSSDSSIRNVVPTDLGRLLADAPISAIFCNGGTALRLYQKYQQNSTGIPAAGLPSTSPANAAWTLNRLVSVWNVIRTELEK